MMWEQGKKIIEKEFFKDKIELYKNNTIENDIGEVFDSPELVGEFPCNIQNSQSLVQSGISGQSIPQQIRVSTIKELPFDYSSTYAIKIISARIKFTNELWKVEGFTEAQFSTVLTATRRIVV